MIMDVTVPAGGCYVKVGTELKCDSPVDPQGNRACEYQTSLFISSTEEANWSETETESEEVSVSETEGRSSSTTSQFGGSSYDTSTTTTHTRRFETTIETGGSNTATGSSTDTAKTYLFGRSCQRQYLHITGFGFGDVDTEGTCAYSNVVSTADAVPYNENDRCVDAPNKAARMCTDEVVNAYIYRCIACYCGTQPCVGCAQMPERTSSSWRAVPVAILGLAIFGAAI
jgi:hypothetical protein